MRFEHARLPTRRYVEPGDALTVRIGFETDAPVDDPVFTLMIYDAEGNYVHGSSTASESVVTGHVDGPGEVAFEFPQLALPEGEYSITLCVTSSDGSVIYDWHEQRHHFEVRDPQRAVAPLELPIRITIDKGSVRHPAAS